MAFCCFWLLVAWEGLCEAGVLGWRCVCVRLGVVALSVAVVLCLVCVGFKTVRGFWVGEEKVREEEEDLRWLTFSFLAPGI